ncbi:MAG: tetratricopeptide repeat protein [Saprospirales bacterium]|nr:tetratricopeptide repeat protein [Saprospirales bacterium]
MKTHALLIFMLLVAGGLFAQSNNLVRGIVTLQNSNSKPAANVQVTTFGANPVYTNSAGQFELKISNGKPGQTVRLIVQKESYQVLGPDPMVFETGIRDNPDDIIRIVLANVQAFQERMDRFMGSIDKRIQEQNQTLQGLQQEQSSQDLEEATRKALTEQIAQLYQKVEDLEKSKEALARQFAAIDLDQASSFTIDALKKFEEGDIDGAISLMNKDNLDAYYQNVLQLEEKVEKAKAKAIENYIVLARMQRIDLQFDAAAETYREAILKDSTNVTNLLELGSFLTELNLENEALLYFGKAIEYSRDQLQTLDIMTYAGNILTAQNFPELANTVFQAADSLSQNLDLPTALPRLALLNSKGYLSQSNGKLEEAERNFLEGIEIGAPLYAKEPQLYYDSWTGLNSNLVLLYVQTQEFEKTTPYSNNIIQAFQETPGERTPGQILAYSYFLNNLGHACIQLGIYETADSTLLIGESICENLVSAGMLRAIPLQALILNNLAMSQYSRGEAGLAIPYLEKSLEIFASLSQRNPLQFQPTMTIVTSNLALAHFQLGENEKAEAYFQQCISIFENLIPANPSVFLFSYVQMLEARLPLVQETQPRAVLIQAQLDILGLTRQLESFYPGQFTDKVASTGGEIAWNLLLERDFQGAIRQCKESLEADPSQTWIYSVLAPAYIFSGDYSTARSIYQNWANEPYSLDETQLFKAVFLQDLETLEQAGLGHDDFKKIRKLLNQT